MSESQTNGNPGPLNKIKVVDLSRQAAGPVCTLILADMGAEVIKVEEPGIGDRQRYYPPVVSDIGGIFPARNRNKKSITLHLLKDKGKVILRRLIEWGDVLVENYRPGFMKRIGFDYPAVREINPRMIMVSLSAFGQTGPYAHRPGYDSVGQAMGGIMSVYNPPQAGVVGADPCTGVFGALGTALALYNREVTGLGQHIDANLMESMVFFMSPLMIDYARGQDIRKDKRQSRNAGQGTFQTKDDRYILIYAHADNHWPIMAKIMGREELATAPGYRTAAERATTHRDEIQGALETWVGSKTIDEVEAILEEANLSYGRVQTVEDLLKDPSLKARGMIKEVDHYGEVLPMFGPYPILSDTPGSIRTPSPHLGQHNEEVYCGLLGLSKEELAVLKSEGVT